MRIFPEGARDLIKPAGKAFVIIAACMLVLAACAFLVKTWILFSWPRTTGIVIRSHVETSRSDDGTILCSAVQSVQYAVNGKDAVAQQGGHTFTNRCAEVKAEVETSLGKPRTVTYNKLAPGTVYVDPGSILSSIL